MDRSLAGGARRSHHRTTIAAENEAAFFAPDFLVAGATDEQRVRCRTRFLQPLRSLVGPILEAKDSAPAGKQFSAGLIERPVGHDDLGDAFTGSLSIGTAVGRREQPDLAHAVGPSSIVIAAAPPAIR